MLLKQRSPLCRRGPVPTMRPWRVSELRWRQRMRWRPTWSLSWQLLVPRLHPMSTGNSSLYCPKIFLCTGRISVIEFGRLCLLDLMALQARLWPSCLSLANGSDSGLCSCRIRQLEGRLLRSAMRTSPSASMRGSMRSSGSPSSSYSGGVRHMGCHTVSHVPCHIPCVCACMHRLCLGSPCAAACAAPARPSRCYTTLHRMSLVTFPCVH